MVDCTRLVLRQREWKIKLTVFISDIYVGKGEGVRTLSTVQRTLSLLPRLPTKVSLTRSMGQTSLVFYSQGPKNFTTVSSFLSCLLCRVHLLFSHLALLVPSPLFLFELSPYSCKPGHDQ